MAKLNVVQNAFESTINDRLVRSCFQTWRFLRGCPGQFGECNNAVPTFGRSKADDGGRCLHLLIRPEGPADIVPFEHADELCQPLIRILARLSDPDGHLILFAEVSVGANRRILSGRMVTVE